MLKIWPISKTWTFYPFFNTKHSIPDFFFISHCLYVPRGCITCIMLKYWNTCHVLASMSGVKPSTPNLTSYNFDHSYLFASISTPSSVFFYSPNVSYFHYAVLPFCMSIIPVWEGRLIRIFFGNLQISWTVIRTCARLTEQPSTLKTMCETKSNFWHN